MASSIKTVVLVGGSGNLGTFLVKSLIKHHFTLTVVSRQSSNAVFDPSINVVKVSDSYPEQELEPIFKAHDAVVVSISHASNGAQIAMIDAAVKAGVKRFIPSEYSSVAENREASELDFRKRDCEKIVQYLRTKESTGLTWTTVVNGLFFDMMLNHGFGSAKAAAPRKFEIWDSGAATFSWSTRATIADAVARILLRPEQTANNYIYVSTFETNQLELLEALKRVTGSHDWDVSYVNSEDKIKQGKELLAEGKVMMGLMNIVCAFAFSGKFEADFAKTEKLANDILGLPQEDVAEVIRNWKSGI